MRYFPLPIVLLMAACAAPAEAPQDTLKTAFQPSFLIGGALGEAVFSGDSPGDAAIAVHEFDTITAENVLKWEAVHPAPDSFAFGAGDRFVEFGEANDMFIVGHTLIWHSQTPRWVFEDEAGNPLTREALLARMEDHITTVAGRYAGRIDGWDVVNEALNDDGTLRRTPWLEIIGEDYIEHAFRFARAAAPNAQLYYNDYSLTNAAKRAGAIRLVSNLQALGVPIDGIGEQGHYLMEYPTLEEMDATIAELASTGLPVMITELDVDLLPRNNLSAEISATGELSDTANPYRNGITEEAQQALADRYASLFEVFVRHDAHLARVTFWGVSDGGSWLNYWPVAGRVNYPLLFDRDHQAKPAYQAVLATAR